MEKLKVGDVVYTHNRYWGYVKNGEVVRLTNTRAVLDDGTQIVNKLRWGSHFSEYGGNTSYYLETEEIKEEIIIFNLRSKATSLIDKLKPKSLSKPQLDQLIELLTSFNQ